MTYAYTRVLKLGARKRAWLYTMLKIDSVTKSGMENKKKTLKQFPAQKNSNLNIQIPAKILKMISAQNELKIDFPEFQTMGMNVATSEFEYHEDSKAPPGNICGIVATRLLWNQN